MKAKPTRQVNLVENGKDQFEMTQGYRDKVTEIIKEVRARYSGSLSNEKNWFRRFLIRVRVEIEIRKKIDELSSIRNLHAIWARQYG